MRPRADLHLVALIVFSFYGLDVEAEEVLDPAEALEMARAHHASGQAQYERGRYALALEEFMAAEEAYPMAGFLFNIAQCHRNLGHHEQAITYFERYLDQLPDAPNRPVVEELLARSRQELAQQRAEESASGDQGAVVDEQGNGEAVGAETGDATVESERPIYRRWWFWTVIASVVVAGAAVAGGTAYWANTREPDQILPEGSLGNLDWRPR